MLSSQVLEQDVPHEDRHKLAIQRSLVLVGCSTPATSHHAPLTSDCSPLAR